MKTDRRALQVAGAEVSLADLEINTAKACEQRHVGLSPLSFVNQWVSIVGPTRSGDDGS